ncbi:MAG: DUF1549 domain-containing protein, partial [Chthonomonadaceae bacterium]|nr:DUF1549 domain-containing protein [Chthonomonadaceae bacterium]
RAAGAWERVVDRLLASPHYGERWARHWLDLVRYADSLDRRDTDTIRDINDAWRYRDWVVDALNRDMPYDQFLMYQIAGDLLPGPDPNDIHISGTIATGMLAIGNWGNGDGDKRKTIANIADDQIDVIGRSVLGLTLSCARCHDHKFDPITMRDYYALAGIFYSSHILPNLQPNDAMETPLRIPLLTAAERARRERYAADLQAARLRLRQVSAGPLQAFARRMLPHTARYVLATWEFRNRPESQMGWSLSEFARAKGLEPALLRQWRDYFQVGDYAYLRVPVRDLNGIASVHMWKGEEPLPYLVMNTNPVARTVGTAEIPAGVAAVHPSARGGVVVGWKSPITGRVVVRGALGDADPHGGDGVVWALDHRTAGGARLLASGAVPNGGAQALVDRGGAPISLPVRRGEMIQCIVLPGQDAEHDTTLVLLEVVEVQGDRSWRLDLDIIKDVLMQGKGNPHPDRYGEPDVWHFFDMAGSHRFGLSEPAARAAEVWERVASQPVGVVSRREVEQAAQQFARHFTVVDDRSPFWLADPADWHLLPAAERESMEAAAAVVEQLLRDAPPPVPYANGVQEGGIPGGPYAGIQDIPLHRRGDPHDPGEVV